MRRLGGRLTRADAELDRAQRTFKEQIDLVVKPGRGLSAQEAAQLTLIGRTHCRRPGVTARDEARAPLQRTRCFWSDGAGGLVAFGASASCQVLPHSVPRMPRPKPNAVAKAVPAAMVASAAEEPVLVLSIAVMSATTSEERPTTRIHRWVLLELLKGFPFRSERRCRRRGAG